MKTYTELKRNMSEASVGWRRVHRPDMVFQNNIYGSADGLVSITGEAEEDGMFWGKVEIAIHNQVKKGDVFLYKYDDLWLGTEAKWKDWNLEGLQDYIMGGVKHKKVDTINTHPVEEMYEIFEKTLNDDEVSALIAKAHRGATAIKTDSERSKEEREQAADVLDWIEGVAKTWKSKKSLHPAAVVGLMRVVSGTQSSNPAGWGFRTIGWKSRGDGKVPADFTNELTEQNLWPRSGYADFAGTGPVLLDEGRGMSAAAIKVAALATKRWIIAKGREEKYSSQINGLAALQLLTIASMDEGKSFMSKALAVSGFFKE